MWIMTYDCADRDRQTMRFASLQAATDAALRAQCGGWTVYSIHQAEKPKNKNAHQ